MAVTSWRELLSQTLNLNNETEKDIVAQTISKENLDYPFEKDYGVYGWLEDESEALVNWNVWTADFVYTPYEYDGLCEIISAPRNPPKESK